MITFSICILISRLELGLIIGVMFLTIKIRRLRRIFGPKGYKVAEGWRKLHYEKLHNFVHFTKYD
jgi:hypothetical protein